MNQWFTCKVKYVRVDQDGRERKVSETYLFDAVSYTDAESRITAEFSKQIKGDFSIGSIREANITEIFPSNGEFWYKAKISIVTINEKAGKETKVVNYFLVSADDLYQALDVLKKGLSYVLVPYTVISVSLSPVLDVFPYFE